MGIPEEPNPPPPLPAPPPPLPPPAPPPAPTPPPPPPPDWHEIRNLQTGEVQFVASLGGLDIEAWEVVSLEREVGELELVEDGTILDDLPRIEATLLASLDVEQEEMERQVGRTVAILAAWYEMQDLKTLAPATVSAMSADAKSKRWPFVMAMVEAELGITLAQATATQINNQLSATVASLDGPLWVKVKKFARYEARAEMARRAVKAATTASAKQAAAAAVNWGNGNGS